MTQIVDRRKKQPEKPKALKPQHFENNEGTVKYADGATCFFVSGFGEEEGHLKAGCLCILKNNIAKIELLDNDQSETHLLLRFVRKLWVKLHNQLGLQGYEFSHHTKESF